MKVTFISKTGVPCEIKHIVETAGICYDKTDKSAKTDDEILKIAQSLYTKHHHSAFEFIDYEVQIDGISIVALKQITRHWNSSMMVKSGRYCKEDKIDFYLPDALTPIRDNCLWFDDITLLKRDVNIHDILGLLADTYQKMLDCGVKPEDARYILPQALTTSMRFKFNLRDWLFSIAPQRISKHAQEEIREICVEIFESIMDNCSPLTRRFLQCYRADRFGVI